MIKVLVGFLDEEPMVYMMPVSLYDELVELNWKLLSSNRDKITNVIDRRIAKAKSDGVI